MLTPLQTGANSLNLDTESKLLLIVYTMKISSMLHALYWWANFQVQLKYSILDYLSIKYKVNQYFMLRIMYIVVMNTTGTIYNKNKRI